LNTVLVIGAGAAGMMAAYSAAMSGAQVTCLEKNEKTGKKIYISGKGRCNLTNACPPDELLGNVITNPRFLYSTFSKFNNESAVRFFNSQGLTTKVERGNRVFPVSDHSSDVIRTLETAARRAGVCFRLKTAVRDILVANGRFAGVALDDGEILKADACVIATGGLSYPSTGSTGDGFKWAHNLGLAVTDMRPALVGLKTAEDGCARMEGLSLKNIEIRILDGKKEVFREFGEMVFTRRGVSGPVILTASSLIGKRLQKHPLAMYIDLKPALDEKKLDDRILRDFEGEKNRNFGNALDRLLPSKIIPEVIRLSGIAPQTKVHEIRKEQRSNLVRIIKNFPLTLTSSGDFTEAVITQGGVSVREIDPSSMRVKKIAGLFMAGEMLDVDALTGGFNFTIAWSTGYTAGIHAAKTAAGNEE
jgi:predicted Rossmann fold flavoprotein